jgi:phage tail sheath protein FI
MDRPESLISVRHFEAGHLVCMIGLASVKPAEFVRYRIDIRLKTGTHLLAETRSTC